MNNANTSSAGRAAEEMRPRPVRPPAQPQRSAANLRCSHRWIEMQAERAPLAVALTSGNESLTYAELNARANRLAHYLRTRGVGPDVLVGLCVGRSAAMVVGLLGVLKAGGAYVPLDPAYPADRLAYMLDDSRVTVLLTESEVLGRLPSTSATVVCLDDDWSVIAEESDENLPNHAGLRNLAYVIYTSGSTGRPKGAMIDHLGLANYLSWSVKAYAIRDGQGAPVHSSISFDLTVTALLSPLVAGRRIDLLDEDLGIEQLGEALKRNRDYSLVKITPAHLRWLGDQMNPDGVAGRTRAFVIGGEQLMPEHIAFWREHAPDSVLVNEYGPTETVVGCCIYRVSPDEKLTGAVPIGRPIANTRLYVLNRSMEPVPAGVPGELFIGGAGVARGYLNRPGLTADRFIPDPFGPDPGARMYRTGDLARWRPDGNLEYLGRVDRQVKVRGHRIEPGEVEEALARHPSVRETAVEARDDATGDRRLVAYLTVLEDRPTPDSLELRQFLRNTLPESMVPTVYVILPTLPLTPNGKVDREALPAPDAAWLAPAPVSDTPRTPMEDVVAGVWEAILGTPHIRAQDSFFDVGGHSLLATQVISRLQDACGVEIPLRTLFESPTVAELARRIETLRTMGTKRDATAIAPANLTGPSSLAFTQEALWFLDQLSPGQPTFNVTAALRVAGPLDQTALEQSLNELGRRHDSLRTAFVKTAGTPLQVVSESATLRLNAVDLSDLPPDTRESVAKDRAIAESRQPFDLSVAPLARLTLLRLDEADHVVLLTMHHLITDGWSFGLAANELISLYNSFHTNAPAPGSRPSIQYADFAHWQRQRLESGAWDPLIATWRQRLAEVPALDLPTDRPRPPIRTARGAMHPLLIPAQLSAEVRAASRREGVTPFMTLLAAFQVVLSRWSGQDDFAIGAPVANRSRPETEPLLGYFVNMLALRADLSGSPTVRELLARVRDMALEAFENQEIPLEVLIPALNVRRDPSRSPLFQVMFVLQNNPTPAAGPAGLEFRPLMLDEGTGTAKFDLSLGFDDAPDGFLGSVEFNTDLFDLESVERFSHQYIQTLEYFVAHPQQPVFAQSLLDATERARVTEWTQAPALENQRSAQAIHHAFEAQVRATPQSVALAAGDQAISYSELNALSNRLAHRLRSLGVAPETRVGLVLDRLPSQVVAVLGVLKAGGAYVPVEPGLPRPRLEEIFRAASVSVAIVEPGADNAWVHDSAQVIELDLNATPMTSQNSENPGVPVDGQNLAYIIFTSGSTGRPKGVMVNHHNLVAAAAAWQDAYRLASPPLRHLQAAGFAFDVFSGDWIRALTTGGTLVQCPKNVLLDPAALEGLIREQRIEAIELVPALADALVAHLERDQGRLEHLRLFAVGSDTVRPALYRRIRAIVDPQARVVNSYGLTETTIDSTFFEGSSHADHGSVPIGRPFPGTRTYVLDERLEPVPVGVVGELFIAGQGVARGYAANPRQTAERFVPDPHGLPGSRMYATGDRARWRDGGILELLGRRDGQVKIRGFRVELGEVEAVIAALPEVLETAVIVQDHDGDGQRLVACVVGEPGSTIDLEAVRRFLRERLPRPMIPSQFHVVESLPRTHSGKVDRRKLAHSLPNEAAREKALVPPRDEVEQQLVTIWEELLQRTSIGVTDDFFDLGGHSLLAVRLAARVEERFHRSLALSELLLGSTIAELAARLREPATAREGSLLIGLRSPGPGQPLALIHPIGGGVLCYHGLARALSPQQSVLGIQCAGFEGDAEVEIDLTRMAANYVAAIRAEQPDGPYILGGWSMGGVLAFEMAAQLVAAGHDVPLVFLIDSSFPEPSRSRSPFNEIEILASFAADFARTSGREADLSLDRLGDVDLGALLSGGFDPTVLSPDIVGDIGAPRLRRLYEVFRANRIALDGYEPRPFPGRVVLIEATAIRDGHASDSERGWTSVAPGRVTVRRLVGDHYSLMQRPAVEQVAEILAAEIQSLESKTETGSL